MVLAGKSQQFKNAVRQVKKRSPEARCKLGRPRTMLGIVSIVHALGIVQKCKQLNHVRIRTGLLCES